MLCMFSSANGVAWGRRGQQLRFTLHRVQVMWELLLEHVENVFDRPILRPIGWPAHDVVASIVHQVDDPCRLAAKKAALCWHGCQAMLN